MIKLSVSALCLGAALTLGGMQAQAAATDAKVQGPNSEEGLVYGKKLTKAQCLRKDGYVWSSSTKKCVKVTRGSY